MKRLLYTSFLYQIVASLSYIKNLDWKILDENEYCQVVISIEDDAIFDASILENNDHFIAFGEAVDCFPTLVIKDFTSVRSDLTTSTSTTSLLKNPNTTFLLWNKSDLSPEFLIELILPHQPYFFVLSQESDNLTIIQEIQVYSKTKRQVLKLFSINEEWIVDPESITDVYERRNDFSGLKVKAFFDGKSQVGGYNTDLGTYVSQRLNFSIDWIPIQSFGIKLSNGSFTGSIQDLKENQVDIGMATYLHLPERLEVTDGGFTSMVWTTEIIYWKYSNISFIYGLIFQMDSWITLMLTLSLSSFLFLIKIKWYEQKNSDTRSITIQSLHAILTNICAIVTLDMYPRSYQRSISIRIHLMTIALFGAMMYWTYSGVLVSYFALESERAPITSLQDLVDLPDSKILIRKDTAAHQQFLQATKEQNSSLYQDISEQVRLFELSQTSLLDQTLEKDKTNAFFWGLTDLYLLRNPGSCDTRSARLPGISTQTRVGWLYPKDSILLRLADRVMLELTQQGIERKIYDKYFGQLSNMKCEVEPYHPVGYGILMVLFKVLAFGCGVAINLVALEVLFFQWVKISSRT